MAKKVLFCLLIAASIAITIPARADYVVNGQYVQRRWAELKNPCSALPLTVLPGGDLLVALTHDRGAVCPTSDGYIHRFAPYGGEPENRNRWGPKAPGEAQDFAWSNGRLFVVNILQEDRDENHEGCPLPKPNACAGKSIWEMDLQTGRQTRKGWIWAVNHQIAVDPVSGLLAFWRYRFDRKGIDGMSDGTFELLLYDPDTDHAQVLFTTKQERGTAHPLDVDSDWTFSPDGQTMLVNCSERFCAFNRSGERVYEINPRGDWHASTQAGTRNEPSAPIFTPPTSPFGERLVFQSSFGGLLAIDTPVGPRSPIHELASSSPPFQVETALDRFGDIVVAEGLGVSCLGICPLDPSPAAKGTPPAKAPPGHSPQRPGAQQADPGSSGAGPGTPAIPGGGGTALQTATNPASQAAQQLGSQQATQGASNAVGVLDTPQEEHTMSMAARGLAPPMFVWLAGILLGVAAFAASRPSPRADLARVHVKHRSL